MTTRTSPAVRALAYLALVVFAVVFIYPFFIQIATSFKTDPDAAAHPLSLVPNPFDLHAWKQIFGSGSASIPFATWLKNSVLVAAANSAAGVMGKMLSVQNLAVAAAAVGLKDGEHVLLRKVVGWSLGLLAFVTVLVVLQSTPVLGWMVP